MDDLKAYQTAAQALAVVCPFEEGGGFEATIPGFNGLIVFGDTEVDTRAELESVLEGWIAVSLRFGDGLPSLILSNFDLATSN